MRFMTNRKMQLNAALPSSYDTYLNQHQLHKAQQIAAEQSSASFCDLLVGTQFCFILAFPIPAPPE